MLLQRPGRRPSRAALRPPQDDGYLMLMLMIVMIVVVIMTAVMVMMAVIMFMVMMMQSLARPRPARVLAEHQRFDGDRHGIGRHADAAKVAIVEIPQHHAIDDKKFAVDVQFFAQDMAERLRHVAIEHDVERQFPGD